MADIFPDPDEGFNQWVLHFQDWLTSHAAAKGVSADDLTALSGLATPWSAKYKAKRDYDLAGAGITGAKNTARTDLERWLRAFIKEFGGKRAVTDDDRREAGLPVADLARTAPGVPKTRPQLTVDTSQRLQHTIGFRDETTPDSRAKPPGVKHCLIYIKRGGPPPLDEEECEYLAADSATPYVMHFEGKDANQTVHYLGQWENSQHERGPLSTTASATVTG